MKMTKIGKTVYVKKTTPANTRNTEGAFIELEDQSLMYAWSCYGSDGEDWGKTTISACFSYDGGHTWGEERVLVRMEEDGLFSRDPKIPQNIMSVSLLRMNNGDIGMFYLIRRALDDVHLYLRRSSDNAKTWSDAVCCTNSSGCFVVSNDRVIKLKSGRLIVPAAYHRVKNSAVGDKELVQELGNILDMCSEAIFFISDDDGRTWRENAHKLTMPVTWSTSGLQEPGVLELANGVLWGWARTDVGRQYEMFSMDSGEYWTQPQPARHFPSPCSPMVAKRAPSGDIFAVWNPIPFLFSETFLDYGMTSCAQIRTPLVIAGSKDEGNTWSLMRGVDAIDVDCGCAEYPAVYCL